MSAREEFQKLKKKSKQVYDKLRLELLKEVF